MKADIKYKKNTFKLKEIKKLFLEAVNKVMHELWKLFESHKEVDD